MPEALHGMRKLTPLMPRYVLIAPPWITALPANPARDAARERQKALLQLGFIGICGFAGDCAKGLLHIVGCYDDAASIGKPSARAHAEAFFARIDHQRLARPQPYLLDTPRYVFIERAQRSEYALRQAAAQ